MAILRAVAVIGEELLRAAPWPQRLDRTLEELGRATGVDRTYVFRTDRRPQGLFATQVAEWAAPGVEPQIDNPDLQDVPFEAAGFGRWGQLFDAGQNVHGHVDEFPESEQELLRSQQISSLAAVPIQREGAWWGFMGFDLTDGRPFSDAEVDALRTAASLLGAAMLQDELLEQLHRSREELVLAFRRERDAAARLRDLDNMKSRFLDAVSHELRTPLTAILGTVDTLEAHRDALTDQQQTDFLASLRGNARRLDAVLARLLDLDRLRDPGAEVHPTPQELVPFVQEVVAGCSFLLGRLVLVDVEPATAEFDRDLAEQVLHHLLENAAVHTDVHDRVWIDARPADRGVHLTVSDNGPGIRDEDRESIFEPFSHGTTRRPHSPGTGVGLSIVAGLARLHDGRAWCEARPGGGSTFHVLLSRPPAGSGPDA